MRTFDDLLQSPLGHYKAVVYEGPELLRAPLTADELARNAAWDAEGKYAFRHQGAILNSVKDEFEGDNLVTTVGKNLFLEKWWGVAGAGAAMTSLSVGTSNTAAGVGNTSLTGQVNQAFDSTPTRAGLVITSLATFAAGTATITWAEMGSWNGSTLASRIAPIGPYTKGATDIITLTYAVAAA